MSHRCSSSSSWTSLLLIAVGFCLGCPPADPEADAGAPEPDAGTVKTDGGVVVDDDAGAAPDGGDVVDAGGPPSPGDAGTAPGCAPVTTFADDAAPTRHVHVAVDGTDSNGCGAENMPCATIEAAAREATPGTAVVVHAGQYAADNYVGNLHGTADAPIWIGGAEGEARPVIVGGSQALHLSQARYVVVHDLEVSGPSANGINADDGALYDDPDAARHLVFRNLFIHDVGTGNNDCLKLSGLDDFYVLDSQFERCGGGGSGSGVDHVGCHHGVLGGNAFIGDPEAGNAIQCKGGSEDLLIVGNLITDPGQRAVNMGGSTGDAFFRPPLSTTSPNVEARDIRVVSNVIVGGVASLAFVGCDDCLAAHNTIVHPENWVFRILQERVSDDTYAFVASGNSRVVNNLIVFNRGDLSTWVNVGGNTAPETFTFAHNLWFAADDPSASTPTLPVDEANGIYGQDPGIDVDNDDYTIDATSPAAGQGAPDANVVVDHAGACFRMPPSIGAFEVTD